MNIKNSLKEPFSKVLILIFLSLSLHGELKFEVKYGFLSNGTLLQSFSDAKVALKVWLEDVAILHDTKLEVVFSDSSETLYQMQKKGKVDMIVVDLPFFFKNKKDIFETSDNFWSLSMKDAQYSQYYLIANKSLNAKGFKNIKNKTISMKKGNKGVFVWLDKNSLIHNKKEFQNVVGNTYLKKKESTVILNVFFNKSDFGIVRRKTWDILAELNPSILKKVQIIKKSEKIHISSIGLFRKGIDPLLPDAFFKVGNDLHRLKNSESIVELLKFDKLFKVDDKVLSKLSKYYDEYFILKKRYQ